MMMDHLSQDNQIHQSEHNHLQLQLDVPVMKGNIGDYQIYPHLINLLPHSHLHNLIDIIKVILPEGLLLLLQKLLKYHKDHMILGIHPCPAKDKDKDKVSIHKPTSLHRLLQDYHDTLYLHLQINLVRLLKSLGDYHNLIRISECLALKKGLVLS